MKLTLKILAVLLPGIVLLSSCGDKRDPGRTYMPDMRFSRAYEYNSVNPNFADSMTDRPSVAGTIPRGFTPYHLQNTPEDYDRAKTEVHNPIAYSDAVMDNGKHLYSIYCQVCHGEQGDGKGTIAKFQYPVVPNYKERLPTITEGQMFQSVTYGKNFMGSYASQLSASERWQVIWYIQKLGEVGKFAPVKADTAAAVAPKMTTGSGK